jgi:hypothetical protein
VNENSPLVEVRHVNAAYLLVSSYLIPCAASMVDYVEPERSEKNLLGDKILEWVADQFDGKDAWPEMRAMQWTKWWRKADMEARSRALDLLLKEQQIVRVALIDGPWGVGERATLVMPTGDFTVYQDSNNKKYRYDDFYNGRKYR